MFSLRLKELRAKKGISQAKLAKDLNVSVGAVGNWESGTRSPDSKMMQLLADYFTTTTDYLLGREASDQIKNIFPLKTKKLPLLGEIACGEPIFADEQKGEYVITDEGVNADFCLKAKGDSMIGARINDGDIVFVQACSIVDDGEIAVVIIDNEATLKRVYYYREQNKLVLSAENPRYAPFVYENEELDRVRIIGRAVAFQSVII